MGFWVVNSLLISLLLTTALEGIFALVYGIRDKKDLGLLVLVNVITNPPIVLAYYLVDYYADMNRIIMIIILEFVVIFTEAYYFKTYGNTYRRPFLFAFCVNIFSYGIGRIINILV